MISREKAKVAAVGIGQVMFQSRNRGSFDFKFSSLFGSNRKPAFCFNLVIEVLLISSNRPIFINARHRTRFQSRNRGSFDFKPISRPRRTDVAFTEFQSRNRGSFDFKNSVNCFTRPPSASSFNLVIEVLLISSPLQDRRHRNPRQVSIS